MGRRGEEEGGLSGKGGARAAGIALHKLAKIHERMGERDEAARFYVSNLARIQTEGLNGQDAVDALLFLTRYKMVRALPPVLHRNPCTPLERVVRSK